LDIRHITMSSLVIFAAGAAVAGAAQNMSSVIVGRIVMGIGGGIAQQW
jgi:MFS family permease